MAANKWGVAIARPIRIASGRPALTEEEEVITQAVIDIVLTPVGTRLFLPSYGCRIGNVTFEPNSPVTASLVRQYVKEALDTWEKRATFVDVTIAYEDASMYLEVQLEIKNTGAVITLPIRVLL